VFARALEREVPGCTLLTEVEDVAPYECDGLAAYRQLPLGVVLAESEAQVQGVLRICAHLGVP
jgi:glycolate oxidase